MIRILITGDFCPQLRVEELLLSGHHELIFNDLLQELKGNDLNIANLECPLVKEMNPSAKTGPNLASLAEAAGALKFAGINILTLSNNHIMDQGADGLISTLDICRKNNIECTGAGRDIREASEVLIKEIKGRRIAILNFSENEFSTAEAGSPGANPLNPVQNYYSIKSAREKADHVIVIVHGGHEGYSLPSPRMVETYRYFIDVGADIVVGHHAHCYSGYESYGDGCIFYGLGNFIFDWDGMRDADWNFGYAVRLNLEGKRISFDIIPYSQCNDRPGVFLLNAEETEKFNDRLVSLNRILSDGELLRQEWVKFVRERKKYYLMHFEFFSGRLYQLLRSRNLLPGSISRRKKLSILNLVRCEAHRDIIIDSLKS